MKAGLRSGRGNARNGGGIVEGRCRGNGCDFGLRGGVRKSGFSLLSINSLDLDQDMVCAGDERHMVRGAQLGIGSPFSVEILLESG